MKAIFFLILAAILSAGTARAGEPWHARAAVACSLMVADAISTRDLLLNPPPGVRTYETNPYRGRNPSLEELLGYAVAECGLHIGIAAILPPRFREPFQWLSIGFSGAMVLNNLRLAKRINF